MFAITGCDSVPLLDYNRVGKTCLITDEGPGPYLNDTQFNLREAVLFYNSGFCNETIRIGPSDVPYVLVTESPLVFDRTQDTDSDGDGHTLIVDTSARPVTIDARALLPDTCVFELRSSGIELGAMNILMSSNKVWPVCDLGAENGWSKVTWEVP